MGVLIGTVQQLIPVSLLKTSLPFTPKSWLTIAELSEKESKEGDSNGPRFSHFYDDQKGARKAFLSACFRVDQKELGRCALVGDFLRQPNYFHVNSNLVFLHRTCTAHRQHDRRGPRKSRGFQQRQQMPVVVSEGWIWLQS